MGSTDPSFLFKSFKDESICIVLLWKLLSICSDWDKSVFSILKSWEANDLLKSANPESILLLIVVEKKLLNI